jgi:hypothetical protein
LRCLCEAVGIAPFGAAAAESWFDNVWAMTVPSASSNWGSLKSSFH